MPEQNFNHIYYNARLNVIRMMRDRGYKLPDGLGTQTPAEFDVLFEKRQMDLSNIVDNNDVPVFVRIIEPTRQFNKTAEKQAVFGEAARYFNGLGLTDLVDSKTLESNLNSGRFRLIVIYNSEQAGQLQNKYEEEYITAPFIEVYQVKLMAINPLEGKFQSKWRPIKDTEELNRILKQYESNGAHLDTVCIDDPMNRYYGGRPQENGKKADYYECIAGFGVRYRKVINKRMNLKK